MSYISEKALIVITCVICPPEPITVGKELVYSKWSAWVTCPPCGSEGRRAGPLWQTAHFTHRVGVWCAIGKLGSIFRHAPKYISVKQARKGKIFWCYGVSLAFPSISASYKILCDRTCAVCWGYRHKKDIFCACKAHTIFLMDGNIKRQLQDSVMFAKWKAVQVTVVHLIVSAEYQMRSKSS